MDVPEFLSPQAGEDLNITIAPSQSRMQSEIVSFNDQNASYNYTVDSDPDPTFGVADMADLSLAKFLSRPALIQSYNWPVANISIYERFNPWRDFFSEPRIANRIAHYAFMRCKLKLRIIVNGNQFHYGRAIVSYIPLPGYDALTKDRGLVSQDIIQASQRPHIYIDPTTSQGGELGLPYFYPKNMLSIPASEYDQMGECVLHTINALKHANGASDNVTINVFAWAEDVVLSGPTAGTSIDLSPQAGSDEYGQGLISKPATIVARVAGKMSKIPMIAPYMRATEIGASALAKMASIFGYCRPNDISTISSFKPQLGGNMAVTNLEDTAIKLSIDAKQELTLDPRTVGLSGTDELGIRNIASRESYLTTFNWRVADVKDDKLFGILVVPNLFDIFAAEKHLTAMAFATAPFQWWRGTIKYRFQIVASNFHKGRIRVVYEPSDLTGSTDYTTNYNRIIDIAEEKDFTMEIGWNQNLPYKSTYNAQFEPPAFGVGYSQPFRDDYRSNGIVSIHVVNDLTVPNSTINNDIQVNVFVSAGDDFEVAGPWGRSMSYFSPYPEAVARASTQSSERRGSFSGQEPRTERVTSKTRPDRTPLRQTILPQVKTLPVVEEEILEPQAEVKAWETEDTAQPSAPMQDTTDTIGAMQIDDSDKTNHVFYGESISSFRPLLKRYCHHHLDTVPDGPGVYANWKLRMPAFPFSRGYTEAPAMTAIANYSDTTLMNYLSVGFTGWRGGIRHKIFLSGVSPSNETEYGYPLMSLGGGNAVTVTRNSGYGNQQPYLNSTAAVDFNDYAATVNTNQEQYIDSFAGITANPVDFNPVIDVEIPFYSNWRFLPTKRDSNNIDDGIGIDRVGMPAFQLDMLQHKGQGRILAHDHVAAGEDFNLFFFTGAPVLYTIQSVTS
jgi:hypothetical protein